MPAARATRGTSKIGWSRLSCRVRGAERRRLSMIRLAGAFRRVARWAPPTTSMTGPTTWRKWTTQEMSLPDTRKARASINRWPNSESGTTSYYQQDGLGSVTSLSNSAGTVAETYAYDSYGKLTASTGTLVNSFQYTGREFDSETGIYYYRARYFDPSAGRFLSQDPIRFGGGTNFYAYTRNNPAVRTDPFGYYSGSGVVGSIYLGPDGVWYNDGPPLPSDLPGGCSPEQWAQSPNACAGPRGLDKPDPYMPDPNKKCDHPKDQPKDQPKDEPPPPDEPAEPIPPLISERWCVKWELADSWMLGFGLAMDAVGQEEIALPLHIIDGGSWVAHWMLCE